MTPAWWSLRAWGTLRRSELVPLLPQGGISPPCLLPASCQPQGLVPKFSEVPQDAAARTVDFNVQLLLLGTVSLEMDFFNRDAMGRRCNYQQLSPSEQKWGELGSVTAALFVQKKKWTGEVGTGYF